MIISVSQEITVVHCNTFSFSETETRSDIIAHAVYKHTSFLSFSAVCLIRTLNSTFNIENILFSQALCAMKQIACIFPLEFSLYVHNNALLATTEV